MSEFVQFVTSIPWWGWVLIGVAVFANAVWEGIIDERRRRVRLMTGRWD